MACVAGMSPRRSAYMKSFSYRSLWLICCIFWCARVLSACVSPPQVLAIPSVRDTAKPPEYRNRDYASVLAAIMSVMVHDLKLPRIDGGSVTVYYSQASFEAGALAQSAEVMEGLQKHFMLTMESSTVFQASLTSSCNSRSMSLSFRYYQQSWQLT